MKQQQSKFTEENTVYVSAHKPTEKYVMAISKQLGDGHNRVRVKARGKAILKAINASEIIRNNRVQHVDVEHVDIETQHVDDGETVNPVSAIEIHLLYEPKP